MSEDRFLVTGALGCIGAWTLKRLADEGTEVWGYDLGSDPHRLRLIMSDEALAQHVNLVGGDITDFPALERLIVDKGITHIVHLAALQVPFVRADPLTGARVNLVGTANVLEVAKRYSGQVQGLAYASSVAVYGAPSHYPPGPLAADAPLRPDTLYGVHKQADEGMARVYWQDHGLASVGLRPYVVYGPGRDQGMTSTPTKAMLAAAAGRGYRFGFGGLSVYQHANDTAAAFIASARSGQKGAAVFNLGGSLVDGAQVVQAIEACVPEVAGQVSYEPIALPFPAEIGGEAFEQAVGGVAWTPFEAGVQQTIDMFRGAIAEGRINLERSIA